MLVEEVVAAIALRVDVRVKLKQREAVSDWGWFIVPVPGYIETGAFGPVPRREVEWVEFNPIEQKHIGRLVPLRHSNHSADILSQLAAHHIISQVVEGLIRISF